LIRSVWAIRGVVIIREPVARLPVLIKSLRFMAEPE
jgi:hypothetical protein